MAKIIITKADIEKYRGCKGGKTKALAAFDLAYPNGVWEDDDWTNEKALAYAQSDPSRALRYYWLVAKGLLPPLEVSDNFLKGRDMSGIMLYKANLDGADLTGTNFTNAHLCRVSMAGTTAKDAIFKGARITDLDATYADLDGTDFEGASVHANFRDASLKGAKLDKAERVHLTAHEGQALPTLPLLSHVGIIRRPEPVFELTEVKNA
jgi:hypothetical protein